MDCTDQVNDQKPTVLSIFLRRVSQDDQHARVKIQEDGPWRQTQDDLQEQDQSTEERQLYIRQNQHIGLEKVQLNNPMYGFRISRACAPRSTWVYPRNPTKNPYFAFLHAGQSGHVLSLDFTALNCSLMQVALGFDFDFNPICLLRESDAGQEQPDFVQDHPDQWSYLSKDRASRDEIIEADRVYRRHDRNGIWNLEGPRLRGLNACLYRELADTHGPFLTLTRDISIPRSHRVFKIENLDVPFGAPLGWLMQGSSGG